MLNQTAVANWLEEF